MTYAEVALTTKYVQNTYYRPYVRPQTLVRPHAF